MFNNGDIVRATTRRYVYTSYKRPCLVKGYDSLGKLLIEPFDDGSTYDVDDTEFEIVPLDELLKQGQEISVKGFKNMVVFKRYLSRGQIRIMEDDWFHDISIDDVIYLRGFYV